MIQDKTGKGQGMDLKTNRYMACVATHVSK